MNRSYIYALGWTVLIFILCALPKAALPQGQILSYDKVAHFGLFMIFAVLWMRTPKPDRDRTLIAIFWIFLGGAVYAVFTELIQQWFSVGRSMDWWDALADTLGVITGIAAMVVWQRQRRYRLKRP